MIASPAPIPAIVVQAAQQTQRLERGIVGFRLRRVFDVHAGPYHRHDDMELAEVSEDGRVLKVRILYQKVGGRETDAGTKAQTEQGYEHPGPHDVFARPFDLDHTAQYTYDPPQTNAVTFHAIVRDAAHGDGTFSVDAQDNVVSVQYSPAVLPPYTNAGTIDQERSSVLPDYWALTQEVHHYRGRYLIFGGGATVTITQTHFTRFPTASAALSALDAGQI